MVTANYSIEWMCMKRVFNNKIVNDIQGSIFQITLNDRQFGTRTDA